MPPHIVFDCEVLTPMFLAGADQNGAEIRPASIRGTLRYWYRALLGGRGYTGLALAEQESRVFGNAGMAGIEARASAVDIVTRVDPESRIESSKVTDPRQNRSRPRTDLLGVGSGTGYLWYSTALGKNNRGFFPSGTGFQVALVAPGGSTRALKAAAGAFWLLAHLGGLGTRNRHGAGSFYVRRVKASSDELRAALPSFTAKVEEPGELASFLSRGLARVCSLVQPAGSPTEKFDVIARGKTRIAVAGYDADSPTKAANWFGEDLQQFRTGSRGRNGENEPRPDMETENEAIKAFVQYGRTPSGVTFKRPGFGLPLSVRYIRERGSDFQGGNAEFTAPGLKRRASPMQVHVARGSHDYFDVVITVFNSVFLPGDSRQLMLQFGRRSAQVHFEPGIPLTFLDEELALPYEDGEIWMENVEVPA